MAKTVESLSTRIGLRGREMSQFSMGMSTATASVSVKKEHSERDLRSIKRFIDALLERKKEAKK